MKHTESREADTHRLFGQIDTIMHDSSISQNGADRQGNTATQAATFNTHQEANQNNPLSGLPSYGALLTGNVQQTQVDLVAHGSSMGTTTRSDPSFASHTATVIPYDRTQGALIDLDIVALDGLTRNVINDVGLAVNGNIGLNDLVEQVKRDILDFLTWDREALVRKLVRAQLRAVSPLNLESKTALDRLTLDSADETALRPPEQQALIRFLPSDPPSQYPLDTLVDSTRDT
ncbi:MAG: hypothetical protein Q9218_003423 [Villophora microphyllina]